MYVFFIFTFYLSMLKKQVFEAVKRNINFVIVLLVKLYSSKCAFFLPNIIHHYTLHKIIIFLTTGVNYSRFYDDQIAFA